MNQEQPSLDVIVSEPISNRDDDLAKKEADFLADDAKRKNEFKGHLHRIIILFMYFAAALVGILFFIRVWHFAAPQCVCWLDKEHLHDIERIIFSSAFVTALSFYMKNVIRVN